MLVGGRPQFAHPGTLRLTQVASQGAAAAAQSPRQLAAIEIELRAAALGMQADLRVQLERRVGQGIDRPRELALGVGVVQSLKNPSMPKSDSVSVWSISNSCVGWNALTIVPWPSCKNLPSSRTRRIRNMLRTR